MSETPPPPAAPLPGEGDRPPEPQLTSERFASPGDLNALRSQIARLEDAILGLRGTQDPQTDRIARRLDDVSAAIEKLNEYQGNMERLFKFLYDDLEEAKANRQLDEVRPLYLDLILLSDRLDELGATTNAAAVVHSARAEVIEVLSRRGVEELAVTTDKFDPRWQSAVQVVPPTEPGLSGRVASVVRPGFRLGDRVLRHQQVRVWGDSGAPTSNLRGG